MYDFEVRSRVSEMVPSEMISHSANRRGSPKVGMLIGEQECEARGRRGAATTEDWREIRYLRPSMALRHAQPTIHGEGRNLNEPVGSRGASAKRAHAASLRGSFTFGSLTVERSSW
jgi:hypothetical protein